MRVSIALIVNAPICTHAFVNKVFLNIVRCIFDLFLSAPFFRKRKLKRPAELCIRGLLNLQNFIPQTLFLKSKFKFFQCSIFVICSFISDRFLEPSDIFSRYIQPFLWCIFTHQQAGINNFSFGSVITDPACFFIFHHIAIEISRCRYDGFSFAASNNLYCIMKNCHDPFPPFLPYPALISVR